MLTEGRKKKVKQGATKRSVSAFLIIQPNAAHGGISKHLAGDKAANGLQLPF